MAEISKKLKQRLRQYASRAWDAEVQATLQALAVKFERWKKGGMSSADLNDAIHEYHDGVAREIWKRFSTNKPGMPLAHAVAAGFVTKESLPAEVLEHIESMVEYFQDQMRDE